MIRILKFGFALAAVVAIGAIGASTALAQNGDLTSTGPMTLYGTEIGENYFSTFSTEIKCPGSLLTGHKSLGTSGTAEGRTHEMIPVNSTAFTATIDLANCGSPVKLTITTWGCDYDIHIGKKIAEDAYSVSTDIVCPQGQQIEWTFYSFANSELGGVQCTTKIGPQTGITGPTLKVDTENDDLRLEGRFSGIHLTRSGASCSGEGTGFWEVNMTLKATNEVGTDTGITISEVL